MSSPTFIRSLFATALLAALAQPANALTTLNFDNLAGGSAANADLAAQAAGISLDNGYHGTPIDANGNPVLDGNGDPLTTVVWMVDPIVTSPVTVEDTNAQGFGIAPSSPNALDARFSPVLLHFASPMNVTGFSFTLPNSTFGTPGNSEVDFVDGAGQIITALTFTQGNPLSQVAWSGGPILGVKDIALASGTFYDNISITAVPIPATLPLMLSGMAGLWAGFARRKTV